MILKIGLSAGTNTVHFTFKRNWGSKKSNYNYPLLRGKYVIKKETKNKLLLFKRFTIKKLFTDHKKPSETMLFSSTTLKSHNCTRMKR